MMARRKRCILKAPETIIMKKRTFLLSLLLLIVAASVSAQNLPARPTSAPTVPLNLSLPKKAVSDKAPGTEQEKLGGPFLDQQESSEMGGNRKEERSALRMPYGTGFENRQQGLADGGGFRGGRGRRK